MSDISEEFKNKIFLGVVNELSPFRYFYFIIFPLLFFSSIIFRNIEYKGLFPFSMTMETDGCARLLVDMGVLYIVISVILMFCFWSMRGITQSLSDNITLIQSSSPVNKKGVKYARSCYFWIMVFISFLLFVYLMIFTVSNSPKSGRLAYLLHSPHLMLASFICVMSFCVVISAIYFFQILVGYKNVK